MINDDFQNKEYRTAFVDAMIRTGIAFQIKALRKREPWSQKELGENVNTPQNVISRYENPDYGGFTLKTLQRLASAFDVALIVKFATFGELIRLTEDRSPEVLAVSSFSKEQELVESHAIPENVAVNHTLEIQITDYADIENIVMLDSVRTNSSDTTILERDHTDQYEYSHASN